MNVIKLTREERKLLMRLYKSSPNEIEKKNTLGLLLCNRGLSKKKIAKILNIALEDICLLEALWISTSEQNKYKILTVKLFTEEIMPQ